MCRLSLRIRVQSQTTTLSFSSFFDSSFSLILSSISRRNSSRNSSSRASSSSSSTYTPTMTKSQYKSKKPLFCEVFFIKQMLAFDHWSIGKVCVHLHNCWAVLWNSGLLQNSTVNIQAIHCDESSKRILGRGVDRDLSDLVWNQALQFSDSYLSIVSTVWVLDSSPHTLSFLIHLPIFYFLFPPPRRIWPKSCIYSYCLVSYIIFHH